MSKPGLISSAIRREFEERRRLKAMKADAERDFLCFVRMMWPILEPEKPLVEGWLLDFLADVFMAVGDGELNRVCINVPPGATKSTLLNVLFPAWQWGPCNKPHMRYISVSYSTAVPIRDNLRFAQIIRHPVYQACWGDRVQVTREGAEWVANSKTGWKMVSSTGGGITGFRADLLALDDLNNPGSVESDVVRETTNRFVREIMPSRVNDLEKSAIINLQQRTHQNDATGTLIEHGQNYVFVAVPMEFDPLRICSVVLRRDENGDPAETWIDPRALDENGEMLEGLTENERGEPTLRFGSPMAKAEGESCWPERFPEQAMQTLKASMTSYAWSSQFNQIPGVRGGAIIRREWWKLWDDPVLPEFGTVLVSVDTALEQKESADWNACTAWGAFAAVGGEPLLMLIGAWRVRAPLAQLVTRVAETCRQHHADYLLVEHKTRGRDLHDEIVRLYQNASWETVLVLPGSTDKVARLNAVSHLFSGDVRHDPVMGVDVWEGGIVYAPNKEWSDEVISEAAQFPYATHDDYVDTVSQALGWVRKNGVVLRRVEYDDREYERAKYKKPLSVPYSIVRGG